MTGTNETTVFTLQRASAWGGELAKRSTVTSEARLCEACTRVISVISIRGFCVPKHIKYDTEVTPSSVSEHPVWTGEGILIQIQDSRFISSSDVCQRPKVIHRAESRQIERLYLNKLACLCEASIFFSRMST